MFESESKSICKQIDISFTVNLTDSRTNDLSDSICVSPDVDCNGLTVVRMIVVTNKANPKAVEQL